MEVAVGSDVQEGAGGGPDVGKIPVVLVVVDDVAEGTEGLHESLGGTITEEGRDGEFFADLFPEIEEACDVFLGVVHVGIVEEGCEVVFLVAEAHALEVDEPGLVVVDEDILRLEVAVDEVAVGGAESFAEGGQGGIVVHG